jgi:hypothetical protein
MDVARRAAPARVRDQYFDDLGDNIATLLELGWIVSIDP